MVSQYTMGDYTNCRYDICEILRDGECFVTVGTADADLIIKVLEENENVKLINKKCSDEYVRMRRRLERLDKDWDKLYDFVCSNGLEKEMLEELGWE